MARKTGLVAIKSVFEFDLNFVPKFGIDLFK